MRKSVQIVIIIAAAHALWATAAGAVIHYSAVFDQVEVNQEGQANDFGSSSGFPTFTGDFSLDKQLRLTFSAPAGKQFMLNRPTGATSWQLLADIWDDNSLLVNTTTPGVSYSFTNLQGAVSPTAFEVDSGPQGFIAKLYSDIVTDAIAFTSVSMLFDIPSGFNESYVNYDLARVFFRGWAGDNPSEDPYAFITDAQPIPEPATFGLFGLGMAGLAWSRRRRARGRNQIPPTR